MKKCINCGDIKPIDQYYRHKQMKDGFLNKCKECCKTQSKESYCKLKENPSWLAKERLRGRVKARKYKYNTSSESRTRANKKYAQINKEKRNASNAVRCKIDVPNGYEAHHWSYNKDHYTDVFFLKSTLHQFIHRFMIYDRELKMYRVKNSGLVLDTKQKHGRFIDSLLVVFEMEQEAMKNKFAA